MLYLERWPGESIKIGPDITIRVKGFNQGRVVLGIDAPRDMPIVRVLRDDRPAGGEGVQG